MGNNDDRIITEQVNNRLADIFGEDDDQPDSRTGNEDLADDADNLSDDARQASLDNRLDNFFEHGNSPDNGEKFATNLRALENSAIKDLKSVILSLEWEITDQVMHKLGEEIHKLEETHKSDKIVIAFLQLLGSLGKYIRKKKAEAHPDSIRLLNTVYEHLEQVMLSDDLSDSEKKKMLVTQVNNYKKLKEEILVAKTAPAPAKKEKAARRSAEDEESESSDDRYRLSEESGAAESSRPSASTASDEVERHHQILQVLEEIRDTIHSELRALRADLKK